MLSNKYAIAVANILLSVMSARRQDFRHLNCTKGMVTDANTRKAAERARKRAAGLSPLEVWLPRDLHDRVRKYVKRIARQSIKG
jgi:hypothetical protein